MACAKCDFYTPKDSSRALLEPVQHVEDDLALADLDLEAGERAGARVAAPDPERCLAHQWFSSGSPASSPSVMYLLSSARSNRASRSGRIGGTG
jgi:hypothetical protein